MATKIEKLVDLNACNSAIYWCKGFKSLESAWKNCTRIDWLIWYFGRINPHSTLLIRVACECVLTMVEKIPIINAEDKKFVDRAKCIVAAVRYWRIAPNKGLRNIKYYRDKLVVELSKRNGLEHYRLLRLLDIVWNYVHCKCISVTDVTHICNGFVNSENNSDDLKIIKKYIPTLPKKV